MPLASEQKGQDKAKPKRINRKPRKERVRQNPATAGKGDRITLPPGQTQATSVAQYEEVSRGMGPLLCGAKRRGSKEPCRQYAGWGTSHPGFGYCKMHGGTTPGGIAYAEKQMLDLHMRKQGVLYGTLRDIGPHEALIEEVQRTAGHVAWLQLKIQEMKNIDALIQDSAKDGRKPDAIHQMYMEERKHLVNVCNTAIRCGIEERRVRLAEEQGKMIAGMFVMLINNDDLALSPRQRMIAQRISRDLLLAVPQEPLNTVKAMPTVTADGSLVDDEGYPVEVIPASSTITNNPAPPNKNSY